MTDKFIIPKSFSQKPYSPPTVTPLRTITMSECVKAEAVKAEALEHAMERFHREGPFIFATDDPHGIALRAAGKRVVYVDNGSIFVDDR